MKGGVGGQVEVLGRTFAVVGLEGRDAKLEKVLLQQLKLLLLRGSCAGVEMGGLSLAIPAAWGRARGLTFEYMMTSKIHEPWCFKVNTCRGNGGRCIK